jgi:hypothetical protein
LWQQQLPFARGLSKCLAWVWQEVMQPAWP